jgi:hypothetical protein
VAAFQQLQKIKDQKTRNLLRGIITGARAPQVSATYVNGFRKRADLDDLVIGIELLLGKNGAFPFSNLGSTYESLLRPHSLAPLPAEVEAAFVAGHVNGWKEEACNIIAAMGALAALPTSDPHDAMSALAAFSERYGASSFLVRKVAYLMTRYGESTSLEEPLQKIAEKVGQAKHPAPYFMAMELLDAGFPYFSAASMRIQILSKYIKDDYRQILTLHDLVPVPLSHSDAAAHLRKAHSTSLVDEIVSIICILTMRERWPTLAAALIKHLHSSVAAAIETFLEVEFDPSVLYSDSELDWADLTYYRRSLAFVEFKQCALYRAYVDSVVAPRLIPGLELTSAALKHWSIPSPRDLTKRLQGFRRPLDYLSAQACGRFLRTIQFLIYLTGARGLTAFSDHDIRFVFEHTMALDILLTEGEIEKIYLSADSDTRPLITVLALALHKAKNHDDDVDFKFRAALCQTVSKQYNSSIAKFIEWLLPSSPQIANYLIEILDRQTLQKLYWIIQSADEADAARQELLRSVGKQRGAIEYFVEADAIGVQRQVAKLRKYFDDSRIYVDGIAMKNWLIENPSAYARQYIKMIEHNVSLATARAKEINTAGKIENGMIVLAGVNAFDYILVEVARVAFEQFCTNRDFGIESYLGRRIRHNTLTGMMRGGVEDLMNEPQFRALTYDQNFASANERWIDDYRASVELLRRDILQFRSDQRPRGIFSAELKNDENTKHNVAALRNMMLAAKNPELLNELLIRFCWQEIDPQLVAATKFISVDLLQAAYEKIEHYLGDFDDDIHRQYRTQLREAVHERFTRLGSWFRQPENGFVSASTRQLAELILVESMNGRVYDEHTIDWAGEGVDVLIDGLSVHRMYDCLFVLLRNALRYGAQSEPVKVLVERLIHTNENVSRFRVSVTSAFRKDEREYHLERLRSSFATDDLGAAMVVEGYSGLKKLRFITRSSEGLSTADYAVEGDICTVSFELTVELASADKAAA